MGPSRLTTFTPFSPGACRGLFLRILSSAHNLSFAFCFLMSNTFSIDMLPESIRESLSSRYKELGNRKCQSVLQLKAIFSWLCATNPTLERIEVEYQGSDDSGSVENIDIHPSELAADILSLPLPNEIAFGHTSGTGSWDPQGRKWVLDRPGQNESVEEALDRICWDIAYGQNPGFEINEGGYGTVTVSRNDDDNDNELEPVINLEHSERIESINDYSYEF